MKRKRRQRHWYKIIDSKKIEKFLETGHQVKDCGDHFKVLLTPAELIHHAYENSSNNAINR